MGSNIRDVKSFRVIVNFIGSSPSMDLFRSLIFIRVESSEISINWAAEVHCCLLSGYNKLISIRSMVS